MAAFGLTSCVNVIMAVTKGPQWTEAWYIRKQAGIDIYKALRFILPKNGL